VRATVVLEKEICRRASRNGLVSSSPTPPPTLTSLYAAPSVARLSGHGRMRRQVGDADLIADLNDKLGAGMLPAEGGAIEEGGFL
jgi:hypothetical protein